MEKVDHPFINTKEYRAYRITSTGNSIRFPYLWCSLLHKLRLSQELVLRMKSENGSLRGLVRIAI